MRKDSSGHPDKECNIDRESLSIGGHGGVEAREVGVEDQHVDLGNGQDSPLHIAPSDVESSPTASNYSDTKRAELDRRSRRKHRRNSNADTEEEDLEDDRDLESEAVPEPDVPMDRSSTAKGKQPM